MMKNTWSRRRVLKLVSAGGAAVVVARAVDGAAAVPAQPRPHAPAERASRLQWWHDARFGMFIHWGVYSTLGRHEWAMENEALSVAEYEPFAKQFKPKPNAARDWARLARRAGQKYMVMTTKHHEGFCLFDTKTTNFCAPRQGPGRDLVREYVEAARAEDLRVGFYYSLMDWHHPDGARLRDR
jgi:alpha-L-fucosidase